jgi:hypothetical protein
LERAAKPAFSLPPRPNNRASLLDMAWNWFRLAEQAEKNIRLREAVAAPKK